MLILLIHAPDDLACLAVEKRGLPSGSEVAGSVEWLAE
jgi:hypothetical protein